MTLGPHAARRALLALLAVPCLMAQQAPKTPMEAPRPPLQVQIDQLREGQDRLLEELKGIKVLLQGQSSRVETPAARRSPETLTVNVLGEPFKGNPRARVAILEYSDFDCSYCAKYATEIYPLLDHLYLQGDKVKYFFRDLPGPGHVNAEFKAQVARCAGDQGRFWEAHDRLFKDQGPLDASGLAKFAQGLGLDETQFKACLAGDTYREAIRRSAMGATRMRIDGTPAFLIGTLSEDGSVLTAVKVFLGAESFQAFRTVLDELLKPAVPPAQKP